MNPTRRPLPDNTQRSQETDRHALGGIRTRKPNKRSAADLCLSRSLVMIVLSGRLESMGYFAGVERLGMHTEFWDTRLEGADTIICILILVSFGVTGTSLRTCVNSGWAQTALKRGCSYYEFAGWLISSIYRLKNLKCSCSCIQHMF
jgi:hypothetical protein